MLSLRTLVNSLGRKQRPLVQFAEKWCSDRDLHIASTNKTAYEGDGKTKVNILNTDLSNGLMIVGFSQFGFRLNNEMAIMGPMALFPRSVLAWNINSYADINEESLSLFCALEPRVEVLILGIGDQPSTPEFSQKIGKFMRSNGISVDILRTEQACSTFNFLNAESRMVAAALIPPAYLSFNENDVLQTKLQRKEMHEMF